MKVKIHFTKSRGDFKIFSLGIRAIEKRPYSHVCIEVVDQLTKIPLIYQASKSSVNCANLDIFLEENEIVETYTLILSLYEFVELMAVFNLNLGRKYSIKQIIRILYYKITKDELNVNNNDLAFICSEIIYKAIKSRLKTKVKNPDFVTPSGLNKLINEAGVPRG